MGKTKTLIHNTFIKEFSFTDMARDKFPAAQQENTIYMLVFI